jgi:hypothetical protein
MFPDFVRGFKYVYDLVGPITTTGWKSLTVLDTEIDDNRVIVLGEDGKPVMREYGRLDRVSMCILGVLCLRTSWWTMISW